MDYSDFYKTYQHSRNMAWNLLIDQNIMSLPINMQTICRNLAIPLYNYQNHNDLILKFRLEPYIVGNDGFTTLINGHPIIFFDQNVKTFGRLNFTLAHELGHILLSHLDIKQIAYRQETCVTPWNKGEEKAVNELESAANIFASRLLAPACILKELDITSPIEIQELTGLSYSASLLRYKRLQTLMTRNKFYRSPLEKQVRKQFMYFIECYHQ